MRVSNTTITTGLESKEINEKVKMVGIVGDGSLSPLNSASWYEVMLHTVSSPSISLSKTHTHTHLVIYLDDLYFIVLFSFVICGCDM